LAFAFAVASPPQPIKELGAPYLDFEMWDAPHLVSLFSAPSARPHFIPPQIPNVYAQIPHPQTIFHAFTQQNRMSTPQIPQETNNSNPINKIKVSQSDF
jgi:hypothetical protein